MKIDFFEYSIMMKFRNKQKRELVQLTRVEPALFILMIVVTR